MFLLQDRLVLFTLTRNLRHALLPIAGQHYPICGDSACRDRSKAVTNPVHEVNIIIDKKHKKSPTPTTGAALYVLGEVKPGYDLFRETPGQKDDELIRNDSTQYTLHDGEKFYSAQQTLNPGGARCLS